MRRIPVYCALFWMLFALLICLESLRLKLGAINNPGPGFFPFSVGSVMFLLSAGSLFQEIRKQAQAGKPSDFEGFRWWNIVIILGAITAYALTLETLGFLINTFIFVCLLLKVIEPQSWKTALLGGLIAAITSDVLFRVIFQAQIPTGITGF